MIRVGDLSFDYYFYLYNPNDFFLQLLAPRPQMLGLPGQQGKNFLCLEQRDGDF